VRSARLAACLLATTAPVLFAEIEGAQHAFDVFLSPRSVPVIEGVSDFLDEVHRRYVDRRRALRHDARGAAASTAGLARPRTVEARMLSPVSGGEN